MKQEAKPMMDCDVVLLTESRYDTPSRRDWYIDQILEEDRMAKEALQEKGLRVCRTDWRNPDFEWQRASCAVFRTTWDYFHRHAEFQLWLDRVSGLTSLINPPEMVKWNMDKHYLAELSGKGINIPPTVILEKGDVRSLVELCDRVPWDTSVLKPVVSGAGRHTYRFGREGAFTLSALYGRLIQEEAMMLQEFQHSVPVEGEVAVMMFDGRYSHAVLKKAKKGEFRVQDDFGGTVHPYEPSAKEIEFAEKVMACVDPVPAYGRVDYFLDNGGELCLAELELIEPELWFRLHPPAAKAFASSIAGRL